MRGSDFESPLLGRDAGPAGELLRLYVFRVGSEEYALDVTKILEICPPLAFSRPAPADMPGLYGVTVLRGQILPILDLRERLGSVSFTPPEEEDPHRQRARKLLIVSDDRKRPVALMVDAVSRLVRVLPTALASLWRLPTPNPTRSPFFESVYVEDGRVIYVLSLDALLSHCVADGSTSGTGEDPHEQ